MIGRLLGTGTALALLGACAMGGGGGGAQVTRMHLGIPIERASFEMQSPAAVGGVTPAWQAYSDAVAAELRRSNFTPGDAGSTYIVAVDTAAGLDVKLRRRADASIVWEGRAVPADPARADAGKLARALFKDFPGQSGVTITVR